MKLNKIYKKQNRTQYSIKIRLNVIDLINKFNYSHNKMYELFHISQKSIRRFLKQEMNLRTSGCKNSYGISYQKIFIGNFNVFQEMEICK